MIGVGEYGKVYLARENHGGKNVAIKVLKKCWLGQLNAEELFLNEAKKLSLLDHPKVVSFHEAGPLKNGSWFFAMEYVQGKPMSQLIRDDSMPSLMLSWLRQVAEAIEYLHQNEIIHGDLQPTNVIVNQKSIKLVDFGLSTLANDSNRAFLGGTKGFVAPEIHRTYAADIFSFGKLIELVLGYLPSDDEAETMLRELTVQATSANPQLRPSASEILGSLNAKKTPR